MVTTSPCTWGPGDTARWLSQKTWPERLLRAGDTPGSSVAAPVTPPAALRSDWITHIDHPPHPDQQLLPWSRARKQPRPTSSTSPKSRQPPNPLRNPKFEMRKSWFGISLSLAPAPRTGAGPAAVGTPHHPLVSPPRPQPCPKCHKQSQAEGSACHPFSEKHQACEAFVGCFTKE